MIEVNYTGVFMAAASVARRMREYKCPGSMVFIASMSGFVANKGLITPVYNSSKAAVIQLGRNLAMEWGKEGSRVNSLCPGHIVTPMVKENFRQDPSLRETWERENMLGRLSRPEEYRGAALFMLSDASSFMTGNSLVIDGGILPGKACCAAGEGFPLLFLLFETFYIREAGRYSNPSNERLFLTFTENQGKLRFVFFFFSFPPFISNF